MSLLNSFLNKIVKYAKFKFGEKKITLSIPTSTDEDLVIKIASTQEELKEAYQVLYESYLKAGFMDEKDSKMRITKYFMLPTSITIISYYKGEIIGTMSLIRDSFLSLPMDNIFDLTAIRATNSTLAEVSALAIKPSHQGKRGLVLFAMI